MIDKRIINAYAEASCYTDKDAYISDIALSPVWWPEDELDTYDEERDAAIMADRAAFAAILWDIYERGIKAILPRCGMSARAFAIAYDIPQRTMEDWSAGKRNPPSYLLLLLAHDQGII